MPFLLVLIVLVLAEIALFVWVGGVIGVWGVLALVLLSALVGIAALRGRMARLPGLARAGADPAALLTGGAMTALGAGLLILPGFLGDLAGLALLLPPVQAAVQRAVAARLGRGVAWKATVIEGEFVVHDPAPDAPTDPIRLPPQDRPGRH